MSTVSVLRYCSADTAEQLIAEIAAPRSADHGLGGRYPGLCVVVESGQPYDARVHVSHPERYIRIDLDVVMSPDHLRAYIHTQGISERRTMWRITVDPAEIIGLADRVEGGCYGRILSADGVLLRPGATVLAVERVDR